MADLADGEAVEMQGSAAQPYVLKNIGGVYSCSCPAWRNQSLAIEKRTCKHLRKLRGDDAETARVGAAATRAPRPRRTSASGPNGSASSPAAKTPPPVLLAHSWDSEADLSGWWMSEKLDGVRAYWDGTQFVSRLGNRYVAPDWFVAGLPDTPLDGELWVGRKQFQRTVSIVRRSDASELWREVKYLIFDAPDHGGVFEERVEFLSMHFESTSLEHVEVVSHQVCDSTEHLERELARIEGLGGEGLMLRRPQSRYEAGRSHSLLKVKSFHDAEARVIDHLPGTGRHQGRLGALRVVTPEGTEFRVGTGLSDAERDDPPAVGSVITYRYQELSNAGVPRFPSYIGIRHDFAWPESVAALEDGAPGASRPARQPARPASRSSDPAAAASSAGSAPSAAAPSPASSPGSSSSAAPSSDGATRYFELVDDRSSKFWEITVNGKEHRARYGKIGAQGVLTVKEFATPAAARADADKRIAAKVRKGYTEKTRS